ncbi:AEC family transporter [Cardiobacteriaceae bacterium TAE3-ERU3]|nr:AEC family transporter [Cardiobacteriaceae bacterium TAE3-ERU3]
MLDVIGVTAPVYLLIALGYISVRLGWVTPENIQSLGVYVVKFALPGLVFHAISSRSIDELNSMTYVFAYAIGSLLAYGVSFVIAYYMRGQTYVASALNGFGSSFSNTGFIGYPILAMIIGPTAGVYLAYNVMIENMIMVPLFLIMAESATQKGNLMEKLARIGVELFKKPIILGMLAGVAFVISGSSPPKIIGTISGMLSDTAAPLALFYIGGILYGLRIRGSIPDIIQISIGTLFVHPLLVYLMLVICGAPEEMRFAGVLLAAVPVGSMLPLLGQYFGHQRRCAAVLMIATTLSFFTISLLLLLMKP